MEKEKLPVLSVKYKIPSPRSNYIIREKLLTALEQVKEHPVTIMKAGAGSGKTTLLSVYIKEKNPGHVRWLTLDGSMNQVFVFWKYLFGALKEELRLTGEECREFLVRTLGMEDGKNGEAQIKEIIENANGWIGGAQLMAITDCGKNNGRAVFSSADERVVYDYMEKEIFASLSEEEKQFLTKTAVLSYFNEEICSRYLPEYNFSYMMKQVSDKNLFVILLDEAKKEYRYHAILRGFLLHMLEQDPKRKKELYCKAADILYEQQDLDECVRLLFECREYESLMKVLMKMPQDGATFSYMMQIPREEIIKDPDFAYQYFFCYYAALEADECEKIYRYIRANLKEDKTYRAFEHVNLFFDVNCEMTNIAVMSSEQIAAMPLNQVSKAYLLIKEAYFLYIEDKIPEALQYLEQAEKIHQETDNIYIEVFILAEKTQIYEEYGEFTRALQLYGQMNLLLKEVPTMRCSYNIGLAGVHIRQLRILEAQKELDLAKDAVDKCGEALKGAYLYTLAEWYYVSGMPEKTEQIILDLAKGGIYQSLFFSARLLRYPVYRGQNKKLAKSFRDNYKNAGEGRKNMDTELLYVGIEYELGDREKALESAGELVARARKAGNRLKIIEGTLMMARFLFEKGAREQRMVNLLAEAVEYAYPEKILLPFWFEKKFILQFLKEKRDETEKALTARQFTFLLQIGDGESGESEKPNLPYELTEREMEVLREIANGRTNKEIGEQLCISLATVKTHLINIYGKLGVNNRLSAVNKLGNAL